MAYLQEQERALPMVYNFEPFKEYAEGYQWDYLQSPSSLVPAYSSVRTQSDVNFGIRTDREDDMSLVRMFAPSEFVEVYHLAYSPGQDTARWKEGHGVFREAWEFESGRQVLFPTRFPQQIDPISDRGDTWEQPRSRRPTGEFPTAKTQAQLTKGPLLIGAQNLIIAMPTNMEPQHGCARELLRLAPAIKTAVRGLVPEIAVGSMIRIKVKTAKEKGHVWLMFNRFKTEDIADPGPWEAALEEVLLDVERMNVQEVVMTMPPAPSRKMTWRRVLNYMLEGVRMRTLRILVAVGEDKPTDPLDVCLRPGIRMDNIIDLPQFRRTGRGKGFSPYTFDLPPPQDWNDFNSPMLIPIEEDDEMEYM